MDERGFVDIWTPSMTRGTPEGARDFLVPVRLQPGKFFALAQSPQLFKQLCMVGGIDRYYQIATCWRDEDLRADRQFEFRQLDLEMAFVEQEDVLDVIEAASSRASRRVGREPPPRPFPRLSYAEAIAKYGSDKPDLRFGLEIQDATEVTRGSEFGVFENAPCVRFLVVPRRSRAPSSASSRRSRRSGARRGSRTSSTTRASAVADREVPLARPSSPRSRAEPGSTVLFAADDEETVARVLGGLRLDLGRELGLIDPTRRLFHWVVDFPLFERDEDDGRWTFMHHPFTRAVAGHEEWDESNPAGVRGQHYDLIWNGWELGSGSIRIHEVEMQQRVFRTMGLGEGGAARQVRLPARRARDGRAAARRLRDGHRPLRRAARRRAGHPADDRVPEGLERLRPADRRADGRTRTPR